MHSWQNKPEAPTANDDNHTLSVPDDRYVVWFDIDNTLYSASTRIAHAMGKRIHGLFMLNCQRPSTPRLMYISRKPIS
jgi:hypothetical protein